MTLPHFPSNPQGPRGLTFGFVLQIAVTIVTIAFAFAYLQSDVQQSIRESAQNKIEMEQANNQIEILKLQLQIIQDDVKYFRQDYERDANKYIRDKQDRR